MKVDFKWNKPVKAIARESSGGDKGLLFLANEWKRLMDPYVPAQDLILGQNVRTYVEDEKGVVHYVSPYAHYQYEGKQYVDPKYNVGAFLIPGVGWRSRKGVSKVPSGKSLSYSKFRHPLATSKWDQAAAVGKKGQLARAYESYLRGGGR